ncbi:MAG TPA: EAL domain-containing protein [Longimicrobiaceae bacterium]|nr:EAL domain-containing protein [Longimicrobiaceae bacterium]
MPAVPTLSLPLAPQEPGPTGPAARLIYRRLAMVAALSTPLFGWVHHAAFPAGIDPAWQRAVLTLACGAVIASTLGSARWAVPVVYTAFYGYTAWVLQLLARNGLYPDYAVGAMVVIAACSVGFLHPVHLRWYLALTLATVVAVVLWVPEGTEPRINGLLYLAYLALFCLLAYVVLRGRLATEQGLAASRTRYALAARGANDGLWDWNLATGRVYYSPRWKSMLGVAEDEPLAAPEDWLGRIHADDRERVRSELALHAEGRTEHFESEYRIAHRDGSWRWMLARGLAVRDPRGRATRMAGSQTDVTERRRAEERLLHDAFHDALTGLPNRALFLDRLEQACRRRRPRVGHAGVAVLVVDLDRFKVVNDSLGHAAGDALLVEAAERMRRALRAHDTVARLGGDEFGVLLPELPDEGHATRVAARLQADLAAPVHLAGREVVSTASVGIALGPPGSGGAGELLRDAGLAMYRAKAQGPGRCDIYDRDVHARALDRLELETDLRRAVERGQLRLHYQPIVSLADGRLAGFEALVRWAHPTRGLLLPDDFIPLAEETGLVSGLGRWVLREACRQARAWRAEAPETPAFTVSVNASGRQFAEPGFVDEVAAALAESGLEPGALRLELTESVLLRDPDGALEVLARLRALGVRLDLDDFGTGYSSFQYLHRFPIDAVKIDRSFVRGLEGEERNAAIVRTLVVLAETIGVAVVAEGVESGAEMAQLRTLRCDRAQGFYFSTPLSPEAAARFLPGEPAAAHAS